MWQYDWFIGVQSPFYQKSCETGWPIKTCPICNSGSYSEQLHCAWYIELTIFVLCTDIALTYGIFCGCLSNDKDTLNRTLHHLVLNALVAISKGMQTVKIHCNKILQLLSDGASWHMVDLYSDCRTVVWIVIIVYQYWYDNDLHGDVTGGGWGLTG